ncbi:MAG: hypothetical protein ACRDPR_16515, partial [Nocardioidaceae bacterium]
SSSGVVRSLLGAGVYLALVGVIGVALGALVRSAAGGIALLVATLMLLPGSYSAGSDVSGEVGAAWLGVSG